MPTDSGVRPVPTDSGVRPVPTGSGLNTLPRRQTRPVPAPPRVILSGAYLFAASGRWPAVGTLASATIRTLPCRPLNTCTASGTPSSSASFPAPAPRSACRSSPRSRRAAPIRPPPSDTAPEQSLSRTGPPPARSPLLRSGVRGVRLDRCARRPARPVLRAFRPDRLARFFLLTPLPPRPVRVTRGQRDVPPRRSPVGAPPGSPPRTPPQSPARQAAHPSRPQLLRSRSFPRALLLRSLRTLRPCLPPLFPSTTLPTAPSHARSYRSLDTPSRTAPFLSPSPSRPPFRPAAGPSVTAKPPC